MDDKPIPGGEFSPSPALSRWRIVSDERGRKIDPALPEPIDPPSAFRDYLVARYER